MKVPAHREVEVVTHLGKRREAILERTSCRGLQAVLWNRAARLLGDRRTSERLRPALGEFVDNVVAYFGDLGDIDEYVLTNILTALATADSHGAGSHGVEDYSTFIRRPNPVAEDADTFFVVGRDGRVGDPGCPLNAIKGDTDALAGVPDAQRHVFLAYHHARSLDPTRGAPRIPVADFLPLVPAEVREDRALEEAFLDVCLSDGAWELYRRRLAA